MGVRGDGGERSPDRGAGDAGGFIPRILCFDGPHAFLSNFYPSPIFWDGREWPTIEHAFQAAKSLDAVTRERIAGLPHPADAKAAGQRLALRLDWEAVKSDVMAELLRLKFAIPGLRAQLAATGDAELVEGNHWFDRIWGQCPVGVGENRLGLLLMAERRRIREQR